MLGTWYGLEDMLTSEICAEYGHNTPLHCYDWMKEDSLFLQQFGNFMAGYAQGRPSWLEFFPAKDQLVKGSSEDEDAVLFVDVGGGMGQDLEKFRRRFPTVKGELVLQDQEEPIGRGKASLAEKGIEAMAYDFFTPQPNKGDDNIIQVQKPYLHMY